MTINMVLTRKEAEDLMEMGWTAFDNGQLREGGAQFLIRLRKEFGEEIVPEYFRQYLT